MKRALIITEDSDHARTVSAFLEQHELAGEVLVVADPTNDVGAHESLHRLASLGTVAAGAAHEVNNLLTYVSVALERMASGSVDHADGTMIDTAVDCCHRMQSILRGITGYARNHGGPHTPLDLREIVDQALELVHGELRAAAELELDHQVDLPLVLGNAGQLTQVLINLLINAIHAVAANSIPGRIAVRTSACTEHVTIAVTDNGHGIPADQLDRVFEAFFTTKADDVGTGLGLYLARSIARKHGGDIAVHSQQDRGTVIELRLPIAG